MGKNVTIFLLAAVSVVLGIVLVEREREKEPEIQLAPVVVPVEIAVEPRAYGAVEGVLNEMFDAPEFSASAMGFCLIDDAGEKVVGRNEGVSFIPASTLKTVTGTTALEILGPGFRFETELLAGGEVDSAGVLGGNLVIRGGGDPTLGVSDLAGWVEALKAAGVVKIAGGVVGDGTYFPEQIAGEYWNWGDVGNGYGSPAAGLNLNHNRFVAVLTPGGGVGEPAGLSGVSPAVPGVEWVNRVITGARGSGDGVMIYGGPGATRLVLRGTVPVGDPTFVQGAVPDPAIFAASEFDRQLREAGVEIGKAPRSLAVGEELELGVQLLKHESAPLAEIVQHLNEVSDNHEAECVFRLLGLRAGMAPDEVVKAHWLGRGLDLSDFRMEDGSGLSRANFISVEDLTRLQHLARRGEHGEVYYESLNGYYDGAVRWKGGAMSSVRSYTGFMTAGSGREFTFTLMFNHYLDGKAVSAWRDRVVRGLLEL